jgi:hypothetical protein
VLVQSVVDEAAAMGPGPLILGGRSMGGRMCSMAVADGLVPNAVGLVLISYPLHPPGRPDKLRVEHLVRLQVPCLFVHGTKDTFGTPDDSGVDRHDPGRPNSQTYGQGAHDLKRSDDQMAAAPRPGSLTPGRYQPDAAGSAPSGLIPESPVRGLRVVSPRAAPPAPGRGPSPAAPAASRGIRRAATGLRRRNFAR